MHTVAYILGWDVRYYVFVFRGAIISAWALGAQKCAKISCWRFGHSFMQTTENKAIIGKKNRILNYLNERSISLGHRGIFSGIVSNFVLQILSTKQK